MLEFLRSWIINIVTISIVLILFEILAPTSKIKKIINLVAGFILLIAVINPFIALKNQGFKLSDNLLADSQYIDKKEIEAGSKILEEKQIKQISEVYKKKLAERIKEETEKIDGVSEASVDVEINENYSSDKFGEVNKVYVELTRGKKQDSNSKINSISTVKKVDINTQATRDTKKLEDRTVINAETKRLTELVKQNLNKSLEIQKDSIVVTVLTR